MSGIGAGRRFWAALMAVFVMLLAVAGPVDAWQVPTGAGTTTGTLGTTSATGTLTLPNGITETFSGGAGTGTAQTVVTGLTTLGSRGYVGSDYTNPALTSSTPTVAVRTDLTNNCAVSGPCSGLGSFTITFSSPVVDPVIAIGGICGTVYDSTDQFQSQVCDILHLTTPGATLSKIAGSNLSVTGGDTIGPTNPNGSFNCATTTQTSSSTGAPLLSSQAPAACGQVQVLGTVTSLTFSVSGIFTPTDPTGVVQGDSCNDPNGPCADGSNAQGLFNQDGFSIVAVLPDLSLSLTKSANPTVVTAAGQTITYSFVVSNTGDLPMSNIAVDETAFSGTGTPPAVSCPSGSLDPGASETCTATYTTTQADLNSGKITNTAVVRGTPPASSTPITSPPSSATVNTASLNTVKTISTVNGAPATSATVIRPGDVIVYNIVTTNSGTASGATTLSDTVPVDTTYTGIGEGWSCPTGSPSGTACTQSVTVGAGASVTKSYTVTVASPLPANTSTVSNLVTSSTGTCSACNPSNPAAQPALRVVKSSTTSAISAVGQSVPYSFVVTNTGNVTLANLVVVDSLSGLSPVVCPVTTLAPGSSSTCTATYTVSQSDLDNGGVVNGAFVKAIVPAGRQPSQLITSPKSTVKVLVAPQPLGNAFSGLAFTGAPIIQVSLLGATLLLLGGLLLVAARRRRGGQI